ncbi:MAG: SDR family oxidoreductase [Candidatus Lindowbacteria bacterium]|nr:SDR family oxidoreductase [Candidatus Lindowbacteria bacterium]
MDLKGKCALVTGAARGIGRAIAVALAAEGVSVAVADIGSKGKHAPDYELAKQDELAATAQMVADHGVKSAAIRADVANSAQVTEMVEQAVKSLGGLHILVNNAGIIVAAPVLALEESQWDAVLNVNLKGVFLCCKAVAAHMIDQKLGRIINISSIAGKRGHGGISAYAASKAGVISLTQSLAEELGPFNVTVNAVCPGFVDTAMWSGCLSPGLSALLGVEVEQAFDENVKRNTPLGRPQTPEDVGEGVVFLCKAENITGIALNIAGGAEVI